MEKDRIKQTNSVVKHHMLSSHGQREEVLIVALETIRLPKGETLSHGYQSFPLRSHLTHQCWSGLCQAFLATLVENTLVLWLTEPTAAMARQTSPPAVSGNGQGKTPFLCAAGGSAAVDLANTEYKHETRKKLLVSTPTKHSAILGSSLITEVEKTLL